jgi:hypothetical protein
MSITPDEIFFFFHQRDNHNKYWGTSVETQFKSDFIKFKIIFKQGKHTKIYVSFYVKNFLWELEV